MFSFLSLCFRIFAQKIAKNRLATMFVFLSPVTPFVADRGVTIRVFT
jgi:hypothetical protein